MSINQDSTSAVRKSKSKPDKPYSEFPLFAHATRRWAKKIKGKLHYFGPWEDADGALKNYLDQRDDLYAGRKPRHPGDTRLTVAVLVDKFLNAKRLRVESGELKQRSWDDYYRTGAMLVDALGVNRVVIDLRPDDFEGLRATMATKCGPVRLSNEVQRVRSIFKYAYDQELIEKPIRHGQGFKGPSKRTLRLHRATKGNRLFEPEQLKQLLKKAGRNMRAMILLGINCAFENSSCAALPVSALDLETGWVQLHRSKTGVDRRCALWPETIKAIKAVLAKRPAAANPAHGDLVFLTKFRAPWFKDDSTRTRKPRSKNKHVENHDNPITREMTKLLKTLDMKRPGLSFYALRHTFRTIAEESKDFPAVDHIMGHIREDMASVYREGISDERLKAVTDHVHDWLFGKKKPKK